MKTNPQDAAFPWVTTYPYGGFDRAFGLTKREYFAALAMQGLVAAPETSGWSWEELADRSVRSADALITELSK